MGGGGQVRPCRQPGTDRVTGKQIGKDAGGETVAERVHARSDATAACAPLQSRASFGARAVKSR